MAARYDAIVIGAGHNGLTCASYLARAGLKTLVLERRAVIGGAAVTEEIIPGFKFSVFSYLMSLLHPKVIADLELRRFGFEVLPASDMFGPLPGGNHILFSDSMEKTQKSFARFSRKDAEIYPEFDKYLMESVAIVRKILLDTPPDPTCRDWKSFKQTASFLWKYRKVGGKLFRLIDLFTMSADDYLSEWFESSEVKAVLAYYCGIGTLAGPKSPGSAYVITHHVMGEHAGAGGWGFVRGGMGTITQAIAASGREKGLEIRTEAEVVAIDTANGRATGVTLADGTRYEAGIVASNVSAKLTFLKFLPKSALPSEFVRDVESYRTYSGAFKINIACERLPQYTAFDPAVCGFEYPSYTHIGPTIEYLEKAYDDAKYGRWSADPFITPVTPSFVDNTVAPPGKHVVHLFGGHAPYKLAEGDWETRKDEFVRNALRVVDEHAPGFSDGIIGMQVLTPPDIERIIGSPHGHIFHGELQIDQLFWSRPAPHYADYRSPIAGLYQCGASAHPGGGVGAVVGHNAAREILKDLGK
ncbi:NAD(P)/FAD-dependent oxidoreductase [Prosthecomicrobium hirschii]|uniref:phytoene desaturase family protein n=1 Tax=Prosthecodimorpha hirschii TaxID=665126 RepID=UPI0011290F94|nr:NAD(P)/FAD-dependent oxidoreductase [Prosthecomicrobium hirschii]TPQ49024.1 NAD(P)/FAD-dependent oxidoreductase [Prosthecomicrobium hirschii]